MIVSIPKALRQRFILYVSPALLFFICCPLSGRGIEPEAKAPGRYEYLIQDEVALLEEHGVEDDEAAIVGFIANGFPVGRDLSAGPEYPRTRSRLLTAAIFIASARGYVSAVDPLQKIAEGDLSAGVRRLIAFDTRTGSTIRRERAMRRMIETLRDNAINALGLIGDIRAAAFLSTAFEAESDPARKVDTALALVCVGGVEPLKYLVNQARRADGDIAFQATEALRLITGEPFLLTPDSSSARRQAVAKRIREWWKEKGDVFIPDIETIRARRLEPPVSTLPIPPRSVEDLLILAADPTNLSGEFNNLAAFRRIIARGGGAVPELERVILDEMQDVNVRVFAIRAYVSITKGKAPEAALAVMRKAAKTRDEAVRDLARSMIDLLRDIIRQKK